MIILPIIYFISWASAKTDIYLQIPYHFAAIFLVICISFYTRRKLKHIIFNWGDALMTNKDENQQNSIEYSIWDTRTSEVQLEQNLVSRARAFKSSLRTLGDASKLEENEE